MVLNLLTSFTVALIPCSLLSMDAFDAPPLWENAAGKQVTVMSVMIGVPWPFSNVAAPSAPLARNTSGIKNLVSGVFNTIQSPIVIGGVAAAAALAVGASWFWNHTNEVAQNTVTKVEAENARLFAEIDRLSRDNEMLLEGSHRATQLNQEVRKYFGAFLRLPPLSVVV